MPLTDTAIDRILGRVLLAEGDGAVREAMRVAGRELDRACVSELPWPAEAGGLPELAADIAEAIADIRPFTMFGEGVKFTLLPKGRTAFSAMFTQAAEHAERLRTLRPYIMTHASVEDAVMDRRLDAFVAIAKRESARVGRAMSQPQPVVTSPAMERFRQFYLSMLITVLGDARSAEFLANLRRINDALGKIALLRNMPRDATLQ